MVSLLLVPIHLDALVLTEDQPTVPPMMDFTRLPFAHGDNNTNRPYLASTIAADPFDRTFILKKGFHLHWALPDALTKTMGLPIVRRQTFISVFSVPLGEKIWQALHDQGWLASLEDVGWMGPIAEAAARVAHQRRRNEQPLAGYEAQMPLIEQLLGHGTFPPVPNRWLITRRHGEETKHWVLESDFLYPPGQRGNELSVAFPIQASVEGKAPFRYLGRVREFEAWTAQEAVAGETLPDPLTAVGYGEPAFAAFYPNCASVFGFQDYAPPGGGKLHYDLVGWYQDDGRDYLRTFIEFFLRHESELSPVTTQFPCIELLAALHQEFKWHIPVTIRQDQLDVTSWQRLVDQGWIEGIQESGEGFLRPRPGGFEGSLGVDFLDRETQIGQRLEDAIKAQLPTGVVCYARIDIDPSLAYSLTETTHTGEEPATRGVDLAVGNTTTEALAAYLASQLSESKKSLVEEMLEATQLTPRLVDAGLQVDLGAKFREARHEKGFNAVHAGSLWTVRRHNKPGARADITRTSGEEQVTLRDDAAHLLNEVNRLQSDYDRAYHEIDSLRKQLYGDWGKYLLRAHRPDFTGVSDPDEDQAFPAAQPHNLSHANSIGAASLDPGANIRWDDGLFDPAANAFYVEGDETLESRLWGPDAEEYVSYIESRDLALLDAKKRATGLLHLTRGRAKAIAGDPDCLAAHLARAVNELAGVVACLNQDPVIKDTGVTYGLQRVSAPRYWQPNDPALLLAGPDLKFPSRYGHDGNLDCQILADTTVRDPIRLREAIMRATGGLPQDAKNDHRGEPPGAWHPFLLQWMVEYFPSDDKQRSSTSDAYSHQYVCDSYALEQNQPDLTARGTIRTAKGANLYAGRTILTPHAQNKLGQALVQALIRLAKPALHRALNQDDRAIIAAPEKAANLLGTAALVSSPNEIAMAQVDSWLEQHFAELKSWYLEYLGAGEALAEFRHAHPEESTRLGKWSAQDMDKFLSWCHHALDLKGQFFDHENIPTGERNRDWLRQHPDRYTTWLHGTYWPTLYKLVAAWTLFYDQAGVDHEARGDEYLHAHIDQAIAWHQAQIQDAFHAVVLIQAHTQLGATNYLSQALGGFNEALIMRRQAYQLPVADPVGDRARQGFVARVAEAVADGNRGSPLPANDFNPIRAGDMQITNLWLVDTFGRAKVLRHGRVISSELLAPTDRENSVGLPPRLLQPARLSFRWLAGVHRDEGPDDVESNRHPATSPICGWLVPNNLDNSLMVYDRDGHALGAITIDPDAPWQPAPGNSRRLRVADLPPHLQRVVSSIITRQLACLEKDKANCGPQQPTFLENFISVLDSALENIDPATGSHDQAISLLVSRPIALVRVAVNLELKGLPANHHGWGASRSDMAAWRRENGGILDRETHAFEEVWFPIRIGEHEQMNDSLVGYWIEKPEEGGFFDDKFYAPQGGDVRDEAIITRGDEAFNLWQSASALPTFLSMLMDPRGVVHATAGILPTKAISIPPDQYTQALKAIEVTFLTAPILTDRSRVNLFLPDEPGYDWSWTSKEQQAWTEIGRVGRIERSAFIEALGVANAGAVWETLVHSGWLEPMKDPPDTAWVTPTDRRIDHDLDAGFANLIPKIEDILARSHIGSPNPNAMFSGPQEIREGWLRLRQTADPATKGPSEKKS